MRELLSELNEWTRSGEDIAIATVVETWLEPEATGFEDAGDAFGEDGGVRLERMHRRGRLRRGAEGLEERSAEDRRVRRGRRRRVRGRARMRRPHRGFHPAVRSRAAAGARDAQPR